MTESFLVPAKLGAGSIGLALVDGWCTARRSLRISTLYAGAVALPGLAMMWLLVRAGMTPLLPLLAGAFMLLAPLLLAGFFGIATAVGRGEGGAMSDVVDGFRRAPPAMLVLSLVCVLLFMIFTTDVAILYSYKIGGAAIRPQAMLQPTGNIVSFLWWGSVAGICLGFVAFTISVFAVPLMCEHRAGLVLAVAASVRGVFYNFPVTIAWAALLTLATLISILILPLLPFTLPCLAYASHALYRQVFPR